MALFKPPTDYRSMYRNLSNDELTVITKNQTGQYEARAVQTAQEMLNERYVQEQQARYRQQYANQAVRPFAPAKQRNLSWLWWLIIFIVIRLIMFLAKESKQ